MRKRTVLDMHRCSVEEYRQGRKLPLVAMLDNVRSMHNIGSVFRTADAFRLQEVCLCGISACPPHPDIHKTALGAELSVPWRYFADPLEAVRVLREEGYTVLAAEQAEDSCVLPDWQPEAQHKYAVVFGHEVKGVRQEVVDACDACLEIPQYGTKHSLNVSVAAGIVLWHCATALRNFKAYSYG